MGGSSAHGALVVAVRGLAFDEMASNAAEAGALGLIVVDNEAKFKNMWVMTKEAKTNPNPRVPAVLVPQKHAQFFCNGCNGGSAMIMRRKSKLSATKIATNMAKRAVWP